MARLAWSAEAAADKNRTRHIMRSRERAKQAWCAQGSGFLTEGPRVLQISTSHAHLTCRPLLRVWGLPWKRGAYLCCCRGGTPVVPSDLPQKKCAKRPKWLKTIRRTESFLDLIGGAVFVVHVQPMAVGADVQPMAVGAGESESMPSCPRRRRTRRTRPTPRRTAAGWRDSGVVERVELGGGVEGRGRGRGAWRRGHVEERQPGRQVGYAPADAVVGEERAKVRLEGGRERAEQLVAVGQREVLLPYVELMGQGGGHGRGLPGFHGHGCAPLGVKNHSRIGTCYGLKLVYNHFPNSRAYLSGTLLWCLVPRRSPL